jgi:hypothetical protein
MTASLRLVMTLAGLGRFTAAQVQDDIDLTVASVGLTDTQFVVAPTLTALPGEFRRVATISGQAAADNIVHMIVRDDAPLTYQVRGFGLFLADGTLFAVYGQATPIGQKSEMASLLLALDIAFPTADIANLTFGDTNFLNPPATTTTKGVVELATDAETQEGTDAQRAVTPKGLAGSIAKAIAGFVSASRKINTSGLATGGRALDGDVTIDVPAATAAEVDAGAIGSKAVTPAGLVNVLAAIADRVRPARRVDTSGLATGGGALSGDITISVPAATAQETQAGGSTTRAVTPASLASFPKNLAQNGSATMPGGLIIKWGRFTAAANAATAVQFDQAFPNACFVALAGGVTSGGVDSKDNTPAVVTSSITAAGFSVYSADDTADGCTFIAIGN